jgi:hypothetical protein
MEQCLQFLSGKRGTGVGQPVRTKDGNVVQEPVRAVHVLKPDVYFRLNAASETALKAGTNEDGSEMKDMSSKKSSTSKELAKLTQEPIVYVNHYREKGCCAHYSDPFRCGFCFDMWNSACCSDWDNREEVAILVLIGVLVMIAFLAANMGIGNLLAELPKMITGSRHFELEFVLRHYFPSCLMMLWASSYCAWLVAVSNVFFSDVDLPRYVSGVVARSKFLQRIPILGRVGSRAQEDFTVERSGLAPHLANQ